MTTTLEWREFASDPHWLPRFFLEDLGIRYWKDVLTHIDSNPENAEAQMWHKWLDDKEREKFRQIFERLTSGDARI